MAAQLHTTTHYYHLDSNDRNAIWYWYFKKRRSIRETAQLIDCSLPKVSRELKRNLNAHNHYVAADAQRMSKQRRYAKPQYVYLKSETIQDYVFDGLTKG